MVMGGALLCKMVAGLIAVKLCAEYVGIENFGLTGQISSMLAIVTLLSSGGVAVGLAKVYSEQAGDRKEVDQWIDAAKLLCVAAGGGLVLVFLGARSYIEDVVLGNSSYSTAIFVAVVAAIVPIGISGISQGILNGNQRSGVYSTALVIGSVVGIAGFLLVSHLFGASGAMIGIIWMPVAQSLSFLFLAQRLQPISGIPSISPVNIDRARFLGKFGLLSIAAGSTMPLAYIYVRLIVQANVGTEGLSLWQATVRLSEAYTQLPMLMLSVIFFAKFASKSGHKIDWLEVRKTYLFITALMIVIGLSVYALRNYLVEILFTAEFSQVAELLVWQLTGDLLRMMSYVGTTILAARGFLKTGISAEFLQGGLFILVSGVLIPKFGQLGPFVAYIVTYGSYLLFTIMALLYLHARSKNHATINC